MKGTTNINAVVPSSCEHSSTTKDARSSEDLASDPSPFSFRRDPPKAAPRTNSCIDMLSSTIPHVYVRVYFDQLTRSPAGRNPTPPGVRLQDSRLWTCIARRRSSPNPQAHTAGDLGPDRCVVGSWNTRFEERPRPTFGTAGNGKAAVIDAGEAAVTATWRIFATRFRTTASTVRTRARFAASHLRTVPRRLPSRNLGNPAAPKRRLGRLDSDPD